LIGETVIDFDTDKLIIFYYPGNAGGKFLINSLGLSDNAVFQDSKLAAKQLAGNFSNQDKIDYLLNKINETKEKWSDLDLGCGQLYGHGNKSIHGLKDLPLTNKIRNYFTFDTIIEPLSKSSKYFFKIAHFTHTFKKELMFWPNAKVIELVNYKPFIKKYRSLDNCHYNNVKGESWPDNYPSIKEYVNLDTAIQDDINYYYPDFKYFQQNPHEADRVIYTWNVNSYLSEDQTMLEFKNLCTVLNINDIDLNQVRLYYKAWIDKLTSLKFKQEKI
jgi:hypothetical protein